MQVQQPEAPTAPAPVVDNPFAAAAGSNPFGGGGGGGGMSFQAKEFKFKDPNAIDLGDDGDGKIEDPFSHFASGKGNKGAKKKDAATLRAEAQKRKEEEEAKLPTKGKESEFFIMDYVMGDTQDLTG